MKICLLTPAHPATNPRLVKEADALTAAGFDVTVVHAYISDWATTAGQDQFARRPWTAIQVGGNPQEQRLHYFHTRLRYRAAREFLRRGLKRLVPQRWVISRVSPELIAAAKRTPADLYIAHNLGALPAALAGARAHRARAGFDAEDFHSEMVVPDEMTPADEFAEDVESRLLPECDYMTAASPAMAQAYASKYRINPPISILNVFPLTERPASFRATRPSSPLTLYWFSQTIGHGRGIEDAIQAMGLLGRPDIELYLQGTWAPGFQETIDALRASAGLQPNQIVHLAPESPSNLVQRASLYDVGLALERVNPRNRDITITNKVFTYILAGNAVAATATTGQKAVIDRIAPGGACYAPGDIEGLAGCLEQWLRDRGALERARRASWEWGAREYNWNVEKDKFLGVINGTLFPERHSFALTSSSAEGQ
jgi:glycosyltransferase involved in cell wall biosynthesis